MRTLREIARAETVGSLLRPDWLQAARRELAEGTISRERARELEDAAVLEAIRLQESAGLDVVTDGEMRRSGWAVTTETLSGFELRKGGPGLTWHGADDSGDPGVYPMTMHPTIVERMSERRDGAEEYSFLAEHAQVRTKYSLPAPSYHRRFWYTEHSSAAYATCEAFLQAVRDHERALVGRLARLGCDYVQLDAPNYGTLCDPANRRLFEARGHDLDAELAFDAALDSSVFDGIEGVTRAMHVCRGNAAGRWHSSGGYAAIAEGLFPNLALDVLLLEYDSDRAGGFEPLAYVRPGTVVVLGLVTTKSGELEDERVVEARIAEAAKVRPLEDLALSPQCGFASVAQGNPVTPEQQRAKLELVGRLAHRMWS
jgi:5-methyltetrahydropteroyltriglutamate--homocysteine methyltransferase